MSVEPDSLPSVRAGRTHHDPRPPTKRSEHPAMPLRLGHSGSTGSARSKPQIPPRRQEVGGGSSMLLGLPTELQQHVLRQLRPGAFYLASFTCRTLRDAAFSSRPLLLHQLDGLPGTKEGLAVLTTEELALWFRTRAQADLSGMEVFAEAARFDPGLFHTVNVKESIFGLAPRATLLLVCHNEPYIRVYRLASSGPHFRAVLRPDWANQDDVSAEWRMPLLKVAMTANQDVASLYRCEPPFAPAADVSSRRLKLVIFHKLAAAIIGSFYCSAVQDIVDIPVPLDYGGLPSFDPVGLAVAENGTVAISWQSSVNSLTKVTLYERSKRGMKAWYRDRWPNSKLFTEQPSMCIFSMQFMTSGTAQLNFFLPGFPIHRWYADTDGLSDPNLGPMVQNQQYLTPASKLGLYVSMPIYGDHEMFSDEQGVERCARKYLALGMDPETCATYVLQFETHWPRTLCAHTTDYENYRIDGAADWDMVARLCGVRAGSSSLGNVMAISPRRTRIAVANWTDVRVWALAPSVLVEGQAALAAHYPPERLGADDGAARLPSVRLPPQGVVHRLCFQDEDALYAMADGGLVKWALGPGSRGARRIHRLAYDSQDECGLTDCS
ncbi:MAG: hypothetical protein M1832_000698 [Thelocarpon impressellum]|nr:MAG: hypothetical protein M1832_000698 [Thelocarpon impressellum]